MAVTQLRGNTQIKDATVTVAKLATENGATWLIAGDNQGVIDGLGTPTGSNQAVNKSYVDSLVNTSIKSPDGFNTASDGSYPTNYKGTGAVASGDSFYITSVANGTAVGGATVNVGDMLIALVDAPGNTDANWTIIESNRDQATETVKGVARIATASEISAGTDDTTIVTPAKLASVTKSAGAGLTDTSNVFDVVAADASLVVNADDMAVQVGSTNGSSLETTATGLELAGNVTGSRTFTQAAGESFTVSNTDANSATLAVDPDGTVTSAIATVGYVQSITGTGEVVSELPTVTNGSTDVTLANAQVANSEKVYLNGIRQAPGSSNDYTVSGQTITFASALSTGDVVLVDYNLA